ncbi:MAG: glycoside hydrolase/phage tail family protein, partial [Caulobacterales bacterium]|nr:glycoside hydrolase/phage tail family protein [Caulobacterales bacterium]
RAILGPTTRLTYAADWSGYFGHQPGDGSGDALFHLDPLWADPNIDAVGIDAYFPLADWRDDSDAAPSIHNLAYLRANIEGGEGFDWFYASPADRDAQLRTPITDGTAGKPWVFRFKDLRNWWSQLHYDRPGGAESATPTAWTPESKPIWLVEAGCPAVDKGANQPNVFYDPKSSESALPHYSDGRRDDLMQRRAIEALLAYWEPAGGLNPTSSVYAGPMIAWDAIHLWTWDARPFPDFPARSEVWADGGNWRLGHWLTGRAGLAPISTIVEDVAARAGIDAADAGELEGVAVGYVIDRPMTARAALEPLAAAHRFAPAARGGALAFVSKNPPQSIAVDLDRAVLREGAARLARVRADGAELPVEARLRFLDETREYRLAAALARGQEAPPRAILDLSAPLVLDHGGAEAMARALLVDAASEVETVLLDLPPSVMTLEPGDGVTLLGEAAAWSYRVRRIEEGGVRAALLERAADGPPAVTAGAEAGVFQEPAAPAGRPFGVVIDAPLLAEESAR